MVACLGRSDVVARTTARTRAGRLRSHRWLQLMKIRNSAKTTDAVWDADLSTLLLASKKIRNPDPTTPNELVGGSRRD